MSQPYQFSMRRMFAAAALLCIAAKMFSIYSAVKYDFPVGPFYFFAAFAFAGATIGTMVKRPGVWILLGLLLGSIASIFHSDFLVNPHIPLPD